MIRPNVNLEKYCYSLSDITLGIPDNDDTVVIKSSLVRSFSIMNDYDKNITSSYMMILMVQKSNYEKIVTNMSNMNASFTLTRKFLGYLDGSEKKTYDDTAYQDKEYASFNLKVLNESNISTISANKMPKGELSNNITAIDNSVDYTQDLIQMTLYMYDANRIDKYKTNLSMIIDGSMNDIIYQLFKQRNMNNLLIDATSGGNGTYITPYGTLGFNLSKLNEYYGIYNYPYLFYMDAKRTYLINKGKLGKCLEKGEIGNINIYLEKLEETSSALQTGCYCDEENKMYILNARDFEIVDNDSSIDYVAGGKVTTIIRGTGEIKNDVIGNSKVEKTYVVNNSAHHSQLLFNIKESKRSVGLTFTDVDLNIFTPNKMFNIIPDDTYYSKDYNIEGKYRISSNSIFISKQSEGLFKSNIQITLKKVE